MKKRSNAISWEKVYIRSTSFFLKMLGQFRNNVLFLLKLTGLLQSLNTPSAKATSDYRAFDAGREGMCSLLLAALIWLLGQGLQG